MPECEQDAEERRSYARRLETLEKQRAVDLVFQGKLETELAAMRSVHDSHYGALQRGHELLLSKIENLELRQVKYVDDSKFEMKLTTMAEVFERQMRQLTAQVTELATIKNQAVGILNMLRWLGPTFFLSVIGGVVVVLWELFHKP